MPLRRILQTQFVFDVQMPFGLGFLGRRQLAAESARFEVRWEKRGFVAARANLHRAGIEYSNAVFFI